MRVRELEKPDVNRIFEDYYRGISALMKAMVDTVPDSSIIRIGKVLDDTEKAKSAIAFSFVENPIICAIFVIWLVLAGFLVFLLGLHFACRILYARKGTPLSALSMLWATLAFLICVITSFVGLIFYAISLSHIREGIELMPRQVAITTSEVSRFTTRLNESVTCMHEKEDEALRQDFDGKFRIVMGEVVAVKFLLGVAPLKKMELNKVVHAINSSLGVILASVVHTKEKIDQGVDKLKEDKVKAIEAVEEYKKILHGILAFVNESTIRIQKEITDVVSEKETSRLSHLLGYTIFLPVILVALSIVGLSAIMTSWKFYTGNDRFDCRRDRRGAFAVMAASTLASAGYTALLIGALLCAMCAFVFLVAFGAMLVCMGLFTDDDLRLLHAVPNMEYRAKFGTQEVSYSLQNTFYKCKNGYPFFDSINGSDIMAQKELEQRFALSGRHDLPRQVRNFHIDGEVIQSVKSQIPQLDKLGKRMYSRYARNIVTYGNREKVPLKPFSGNETWFRGLYMRPYEYARNRFEKAWLDLKDLPSKEVLPIIERVAALIKQVSPHLKESMENISAMASIKVRDGYSKALTFFITSLHNEFLQAFSDIFHRAVDISPQCETLMEIWNGLGGYVCSWIAAPAQGLWVACMVCALGSSAIYHAFFNTARFLHEYAETTREAYLRKKLRHKKLDYVHRKISESKENPKMDHADDFSHSPRDSPRDMTGPASLATTPSNGTVPESQEPKTSKVTDNVAGSGELSKNYSLKETVSK